MQNLRLEWIEAGSLADNPNNWRKHSREQLQTIRDLINDPEVGWAGVCLYNERTQRLIDGHARKSVSDAKALVPVLIGNWSEQAESKILATLDPVASMAQTDVAAYKALIENVQTDSVWVRDLMLEVERYSNAADDGAGDDAGEGKEIPEMELKPMEHHDYIVLLFRDSQDFQGACEKLGIKQATFSVRGGKEKIGMCRVVDGARVAARIGAQEVTRG